MPIRAREDKPAEMAPVPAVTAPELPVLTPKETAQLQTRSRLESLMPVPKIELSAAESEKVNQFQLVRLILDSAGAAPMRCSTDCPIKAGCMLEQLHKAPRGELCPNEIIFIRDRFYEWLLEFDRDEQTVTASERWAIGQLVSYQMELQRVRAILADPKEASLKTLSVKDVHAETGEPICWEEVVAIAAQREDQIVSGMRMIMKDFELTPEQKTKKQKALGLRSGDDLSVKQSATWERLQPGATVDVPTN